MRKYSQIEKVLFIGIFVIIVSLVGNLIFFQSKKLDEPLFFEHYYEIVGENMSLYYLTNKDDDRQVVYIDFPDLSDRSYSLVNERIYRRYNYYHIRQIYMNMKMTEEQHKEMGNMTSLEKAIIYFNNGEEMEVDLGKIIIKKHQDENIALKHYMSSASSDHTSNDVLEVKEPVIIQSITTDLAEESKGSVKMGVIYDDSELNMELGNEKSKEYMEAKGSDEEVQLLNYEDLEFPIKVESNLNIYTEMNVEDESKMYNFYQMIYDINYETLDGEKGSTRLLNVNYKPYLSEKGISNFVESRGK